MKPSSSAEWVSFRRLPKDTSMRLRKHQPEAAPPAAQQQTTPPGPPWQEFLDPLERPSREDMAKYHNPFESLLEPVAMPRWLRGRRRPPRDKSS
jgi:hypothetical protein